MDASDGIENVEFDETSQSVSIVGEAGESDGVKQASQFYTVRAVHHDTDEWAELSVETWWDHDNRFYCHASQYRAKNNARDQGNIHLEFSSGGYKWGRVELTTGAIQDGQWHSISGGGNIASDGLSALVIFAYEYDSSWDDNFLSGGVNVPFVIPVIPVPSINPIRNVNSRKVNVTGKGGVPGAGTVRLYNAGGNIIGQAIIESNGDWAAEVTLPDNAISLVFYAQQQMGSYYSLKSSDAEMFLVAITSPTSNALVPSGTLFKGTGCPGTRILIVDDDLNEYAASTSVQPDCKWETPSNKELSGPVNVKAQYRFDNEAIGYTPSLSFTILGMLKITPPTTDHEMEFTVNGTNGMEGARVEVKIDLGNTVVGEGTVGPGGAWSAVVRMPPGPTSLVAEQIHQNVRSNRSVAEAFRIKPPKLMNIVVSYPSPATVRFSGAGYNGALVEIFIANGAAQVSTEVIDDTWSVDWEDQPPSSRQMNARQSVSDGAGGWIHSAWYGGFNIAVPVPVPHLVHQVDLDRIPVFSGTGHDWPEQPAARIEVRREGVSTPAVPIVEVKNRAWSSAATEAWDPGTYRVQAWQLFKPVGQDPEMRSEPTQVLAFDIKAPLPTVEFAHDGLTPHFSGTCLNNAQVTLWFDRDNSITHNATVTGKTWTFTRPQPFMPGSHHVSATQTIGGQTSNEVSRPFDVAVLRPVITSPIDDDVDHNPVITGTGGIAGAVMSVFDYVTEKLLGEEPVDGDEWSVPLTDRPFGHQTVYAVQTYDSLLSDRSETASFKVILFPPIIDHPQPSDVIPRLSRIDGYARKALGFETAQVELWLKGADAPLAKVTARGRDGYWWYNAQLPVGADVLQVRQFFDGEASAFSPEHDFTVVPPKPVIESPAFLQRIGSTVTISGHGYIADSVEVAWSDAPETLLGTTLVQENRTWSLQLHVDRPAGLHKLVVQQEYEGYRSGWSEEHSILLLSGSPTFTAPVAGQWSEDRPLFEGGAENGKTIELSYWFDSRQLVTQGHPVAGNTWTAIPDVSLSPGSHWVKARQVGETGSDWGDSPRFEVVPAEEKPGVSH